MLLFSIFAFVATLVLLPTLFGELMAASLGKLHLSPGLAAADDCDHHRRAVNIPVKRGA
jgi:hypothetical protein